MRAEHRLTPVHLSESVIPALDDLCPSLVHKPMTGLLLFGVSQNKARSGVGLERASSFRVEAVEVDACGLYDRVRVRPGRDG